MFGTLSGVETLKHPSFHGIHFFDDIFSFFNLVSDFSKSVSQKRVFSNYIKVLIYLHL